MSNIIKINPAEVITMTSLELVDYVNSERKEKALAAGVAFPSKGFAKLEHADLMKKVSEVLGKDVGNFSGIYLDAYGREQPCYHFPKREACLMAMSYSYELQAKVFDKMTALEQVVAKPVMVKSPAMQMIIAQAQAFDAMEQEQQRQSQEQQRQSTDIAKLRENVAVIEARTQPENKHFTVAGYATLMGRPVDLKTAANLGRKCANLSREQGMIIGDVTDPRFGRVHTYHESILEAVCTFEVAA